MTNLLAKGAILGNTTLCCTKGEPCTRAIDNEKAECFNEHPESAKFYFATERISFLKILPPLAGAFWEWKDACVYTVPIISACLTAATRQVLAEKITERCGFQIKCITCFK